MALALTGILTGAPSAYAEDPAQLELSKTVTGWEDGHTVSPDETYSYTVEIACLNPGVGGCTEAVFSDPLPPYVLPVGTSNDVVVQGAGPNYETTVSPEGVVTVRFTAPMVDPVGKVGLADGATVTIVIPVRLDPSIPATESGKPLVNTAAVTATNAVKQTDSFTVVPEIPVKLAATAEKSYSPDRAIASPGTPTTLTLKGTNASNVPVDTLTFTDPANPALTPNPFTHLGLTGDLDVTLPAGAEQVRVDAWVDGVWQEGVPATTAALPAGIDPATVKGVRVTFISTDGADINPGAQASAAIDLVQRDSITDLGAGRVDNRLQTTVGLDDKTSGPAVADATYTVTTANLPVKATKSFSPKKITVGETSTVTLGAVNSSDLVADTLTIREPGADPNPFENGLTFTGFTDQVSWPNGATAAEVVWTLADGTTATTAATNVNTLPAPPAGQEVVGFAVTFAGQIVRGAEARVPFTVKADDAQGVDELSHPNTIRVESTAPGGYRGNDTATDTLVTIEKRLAVEVSKRILHDTILGLPGEHTTVGLTGHLKPFPESTTRATQIVVTDPADLASDEWYDHFAPTGIVATPVPTNATLTVQWFDGTTWRDVAGMTGLPGGIHTKEFPAEVRAGAQGVRFVYDAPDGLAPDTQVKPNLSYALQSPVTSLTTVENCAAADASSDDADPAHADTEVCPVITIEPVDAPGPGTGGVDIEKSFAQGALGERSGSTSRVDLDWSTGNRSGYDQVVIADTADPSAAALASSPFDAFDLVRVLPVRQAEDRFMKFDRVQRVERYSLSADAWVPVAGDPCPGGCDGQFPGYTFTAEEQGDTIGFRLVYEESPTRATTLANDPSGPPVGSGVARSSGTSRTLPFEVRLRDDLRSDADVPVLAETVFNVAGTPGAVDNSTRIQGVVDGDVVATDTDTDRIGITDVPLTVRLDKDWTGGPLGVPPAGTEFPKNWPTGRVTLKATNTTPRMVDELRIVEPSGATPFEVFNLKGFTQLADPAPATGATGASITLRRADGTTQKHTFAQARGMSEAALADVVGFEIVLTGRIRSSQSFTYGFDTRLRDAHRTTGEAPTADLRTENVARATVSDLVDYPGVTPESVSDDDDADITTRSQGIGITVTKAFNPTSQVEPARTPVTTTLTGQPTGPSRSVEMVLTDDDASFWNQYDFTGFGAFGFTAPIDRVRVDALVGGTFTESGGDVVVTGGSWRAGTVGTSPALPAGVAPADVQGLRLTFTRADGALWENPSTPKQTVNLTVQRREDLRTGGPVPSTLRGNEPAPGETKAGEATNTVVGDTYGADMVGDERLHASDDADAVMTYKHAPNSVKVTKSPNGGFSPDAPVPFSMTFTNNGKVAIKDPVITDRIPTDAQGPTLLLDPDAETPYAYGLTGSAPDPANGPAMPTDAEQVDVTATPELLTFRFPAGTVLEVGQTYTITVPMVFRDGLPGETRVTNTTGISGERAWDACDPRRDGEECVASATVYPTRAGAVRGTKTVKAVDDELGVLDTRGSGACTPDADGFHRGGCVPVTKPGADEIWRLTWANTGNLPLDRLTAVDKLPAVGDTGAVVTLPRGSEWRPVPKKATFVGAVDGKVSRIVVSYDTRVETCIDDLNANGNCGSVWTEIAAQADPSNGWSVPVPADARSLKFAFEMDGERLAPLGRIVVDLTTTTPAVPPTVTDNPVAWNTIAQSARARDGATTQHVRRNEANKVGVSLATGPLQVTKKVTGPGAAFAPDSFDLTVVCTSAGEDVDLGARGQLTVTAGEVVDVPHVPWGSTCTVTEEGSGATDFAATTVTVAGEDDEPVLVEATNTYELASLEVGKKVTGHALDAAGDKIEYGPFDFSVACTFLGEDVHATGHDASDPMTVTLEEGATHVFEGLPSGAACTVTETDAAGAVSTTWSSTTGGASTEAAGSEAGLDLSTGDVNTTTATNRFGTGSLALTKVVSGEGAADFGAGPFSFDVVCTDEDGREVWNGSRTLGGDQPLTTTITDLYAGATCTVTETATGGATASTIVPDAPVTIVAGETAGVVATNRFDLGRLEVTKEITGAGAGLVPDDREFEFEAVCTLDVDGTDVPVSLTEEGRRTVSVAEGLTATYTGLPVGAECTVTEVRTGAATHSTVSGGGTATVPSADEPAEVTVTNRFDLGSIEVTKEITGAGAGLVPDDREFEFEAVCTLDVDGTEVPVELPDGGRTVVSRASGLTATYDGLPVGAECTVTETRTGGATHSTVSDDGAVTVASADEPATVTVTNQFDVGEVSVTKTVTGPGADEVPARRTFTIGAVCTVEVDGVTQEVPMADGGKRVLSRKKGLVATYTDLPVGAECTITEPDAGGAKSTRITPGVVRVGSDEVAHVSVVNRFAATPGTGDGDEDGPGGPVVDTGAEVGGSGPAALLVGGLAATLLALLAGAALLVRRQRRA